MDFYRSKERWRYLQKLDTKNRLLSLEDFVDGEGNTLDFIVDKAAGVEETVIHSMMLPQAECCPAFAVGL